jgi:predicted methyltransferase
MRQPIVLSYVQLEPILAARRLGQPSAEVSPDLGISRERAALSESGVSFPGGERLDWQQIKKIEHARSSCFVIEDGTMQAIAVFSELTQRACSLLPTRSAPTMLIGGFAMHRIVDTDPLQDTLKKVATIAPTAGRVLDTATGLGYTAIEAARVAQQVVTIELDPGAQEVARLNPWSRDLFTNPKIQQVMGDAAEVVTTCEAESFDCILHDPPVISLAGELYGSAFYRELFRVLKRGGRMFHYIGNLNSRSSGTLVPGVVRRLQEAGFRRVVRRPEAFGVVAYR